MFNYSQITTFVIMKTRVLLGLLLVSVALNVGGQINNTYKGIFAEADYNFSMENYPKALGQFESLLNVDPDNSNINFLCGLCCMKMNGNESKAIAYLNEAVQNVSQSYRLWSYKERNAPRDAYLYLARAYHASNKFNKAICNYEIYRDSTGITKFSEIEFVNSQIKSCELAMSMLSRPIKVKFTDIIQENNGTCSTKNPVISGDCSILIYVVDESVNKSIMMITRKNNEWTEPRRINSDLGISGDVSPASLSFDGAELYLVQKNYFDSQIFVSRYKNNEWSKAEALNKNINTRYSESHASISRDGSTLLFTSNREGGYGGMDIYQSKKDASGEWAEAVNLGPTINTIYNEGTPFFTVDDSKLYFSSEGHHTMGGFDIFYSARNENEHYSSPTNLGYPINTTGNDLFYNPGWNDQCGYYSWNIKGQTKSCIKSIVILPEELLTEKLTGSDREDKKSIGKQEDQVQVGGYQTLNNILFDYNDYKLNRLAIGEAERILSVLNEWPESTIELSGHANSLGSDAYNIRLSYLRAQSIAQFLFDKGIESKRITVQGQGELSPMAINIYEDGSDAPDGRMLNRHASFKINNLPDDRILVADILVPNMLKPVQDMTYSILLTQNDKIIDKMPAKLYGKKVSVISTEGSNYYISERFDKKTQAFEYLNNVIDCGFPEARVMEKEALKKYIKEESPESLKQNKFFTIQIMALKESRDVSAFMDLGLVMKYAGNDGIIRYTYGQYVNNEDAQNELSIVKQKGYCDAYIVSDDRFLQISSESGLSAVLSAK
jgi:outer membrane protein OmpA-like peptidoglycan-associated protein